MSASLPPPPPHGVSTRRAFWFAAIVTGVVFLAGIYAPYFIVDSWSYLELSNSVFTDFYHLNTLRHFENPSPYSQAFPPLWPVLLSALRRVVDLGVYTGYLLNCFVCVGLLAALIRLFQRIDIPGWVGAACYLSLLGYPAFLGEALGAKTFPLLLTFLTVALLFLVRDPIRPPRAAAAGLLMGLACLTRFDALATACVIGVAFAICAYRFHRRIRRGLLVGVLYFATLAASLSLLAAYGITHFDKPFPSDNTRMVLQARGGTVLDYYETPPPLDLFQHPLAWTAGLILYKVPKVLIAGFYQSALECTLPAFLAVVLVVWGATRAPSLAAPAFRFTVLALLLIPVMLLPATLAGLLDNRYYSGPVFLLFAVLFVELVSLTPQAWSPRRAALLLLVVALPLGPVVVRPLVLNHGRLSSLADSMAPLAPTPEMRRLTDAVHRDSGGQPHRLLLMAGHIASAK